MKVGEAADLMGADVTSMSAEMFDKYITDYSIDSRSVGAGELFFALSQKDYVRAGFNGDFADGHQFIAGAFERGAVAAVARRRGLHDRPSDLHEHDDVPPHAGGAVGGPAERARQDRVRRRLQDSIASDQRRPERRAGRRIEGHGLGEPADRHVVDVPGPQEVTRYRLPHRDVEEPDAERAQVRDIGVFLMWHERQVGFDRDQARCGDEWSVRQRNPLLDDLLGTR